MNYNPFSITSFTLGKIKSMDYKVYIIRCWNDTEEFVKIGKTYNDVKTRFKTKALMPYNYEIIKVYNFTNNISCNTFEKKLHIKYKNKKYKPSVSFIGQTECFRKEIII